jgi:hypothetical protein
MAKNNSNKNVRGNRSNLIIDKCYDLEKQEWIFKELDLREPIIRYIPEYIVLKMVDDVCKKITING